MADRIRTVDFLPEIFQTPVNKQFLGATLDQLVQEPNFEKTQGYVGRRVGPGVNPADGYVVEPTKQRTDYQLEPAVVSLTPDNLSKIKDVITYPGITDALNQQGAITNDANRLYTSDYYAWDPFVDFDKFVNYQQYYWLPAGPDAVDVSASSVPLTDTFTVTRENGVYTFSGVKGNNPYLTLVRGGSYQFNVAQNNKEDINFRVTNNGTSAYVIDYATNPTLTLVRGNTYYFVFSMDVVSPFWIKTEASLGNVNAYNDGVINNGTSTGTLIFTVPQDAPDTLYYNSEIRSNMAGVFTIIDATPGTGPGFWIQTDPGVNGRIPATPNISSRDVLGVTNNGEDLGTVRFDVPLKTAQDFYYTLTNIGSVDLVSSTLQFDQVNNQFVTAFLEATNGKGIDGITNLDGRTVIFTETTVDPQDGGWQVTTQFDPLPEDPSYNGFSGSYDTTLFDQTTDIVDPAIRYSIWQINYITTNDGQQYIKLTSVQTINNLEKFTIKFGDQWASTNWYKDAEGAFQEIPLLTAIKDVLYYQDGTDPLIFGQLRLIDEDDSSTIYISEIIGQKNYTSPNGVVFTNGLKVTFRGTVSPSSYQNQSYYVEGVGTAIKLLPVENFITPEVYTQSETVPYDSTGYDVGNYDATLNAPLEPDYLTINRASIDYNAWSRSNRWFHIDVINASAEYNNTVPVVDNLQRGRRPILEFRAGTKLFNYGTQAITPINVIDFTTTDALSQVAGQQGYGIDGYQLIDGSRVIFAADEDPEVRNRVYTVKFITPDAVPPYIIIPPVITLIPDPDPVLYDQNFVCTSGITLQGIAFWYDGVEYIRAQQKTKTNQAPLFDVYDSAGVSFSTRTKYPSSTFEGSKLFSYATGTGTEDPVLGFALKYLSLTNVGDIVFDNNLYTDTFVYVVDSTGITTNISNGFVRQYSTRLDYIREIGWQSAVTKSLIRQQFQFSYDGSPLKLDVKVNNSDVVPAVQIFVNNQFQDPGTYRITTTATTTTITLLTTLVVGDIIEVSVLSDQVSAAGFYQVPINLENNPLNGNSPSFTLGTVRNHYSTIAENLIKFTGDINGANNTRDLGNIIPYGLQILQQSSPLTMAGYFMRSKDYNIFASLDYNSREYIKFKSKLLETVVRNDYGTMTIPEILDAAIADITLGRTDINPFYWSDMLPTGVPLSTNSYTITPISTATFNTVQTYDFTSANFKGLLVYLTRNAGTNLETTVLLERGVEYTVATDAPRLTISVDLAVGNIVKIVEYNNTAGNYCPNTPSKMGLYPKYLPRIFVDTNYVNPTAVIQGHDGSITVAFQDFRDEVLLEFEKRIYNNIKTDGNPVPLLPEEVIPGQFRTTDYSQAEITQILGESFLTWVGWNKIDYKAQDYIANNPFTYNYSSAGDRLTNQPLLGAWRGIYRYFYDTLSPNYTPWEMLGLTEKPSWWEDRYGPAPYTSDNLVLWDDLEAGYVADPIAPYIKPEFVRPGLTKVIPVGTEGQLLAPINSTVGAYDPTAFRKSWAVGDGGPAEAAWWTSSSYPFAVMRLLALTRPAEFFSLFADRDLYKFNDELGQYLYNGRYRLDARATNIDSPDQIKIYGKQANGTGLSKASFINWIIDYNQQLGRSSTVLLEDDLAAIDVRLAYRLASFTQENNLKIFLERSSPNSSNSSLMLPPESYTLALYKNQPFADIVYSALIIERTTDGYAVSGYSGDQPYFEILASQPAGLLQTVSSGGTSVRVPTQYTKNVVQIPYGYVFSNTTMVVDFILSYGAFLESQGLSFVNYENGYVLNWGQMAQEFLYFSQQGWEPGTLINLNPAATRLIATKPLSIVDTIESTTPENMLLDQNRVAIPTRDLIVERLDNSFAVTSATDQTISYLRMKFTSYEDIIVLNNVSIFSDLVYDPITAARQTRIKLNAFTTKDWNGQLDAQGFILNRNNVKEWQANKKYTKGEIVFYKGIYWSAQTIVQPKAIFDYTDWVKSDYTRIQQGLLPNIANKADQLANTYNTYSANLENDNDLLAYGLIGFRPRQYMAALNLDDVSQINLYQEFLPTKGTIRAAELFTRADLGKESGEYKIYENWGILAGTYGANANRSFFELQLNEALLKYNPSIVQVVLPQQESKADQTVLLSNVWRESYKLTSPNILPTIDAPDITTALPSAGYVNIDDVDVTVFSLDNPTNIASDINNIGNGTIIWVAKSNSYDWNIYRCEQVPGRMTTLSDNLDGTSIATFTAAHGLAVGDLIIIRFFDTAVNGVYRVLGVPGITTINIAFAFVNTDQTTLTSDNALVFYLQTARVAQASDVADLPYANSLLPGARAWVDNDGTGKWEVIEKQNPFTEISELSASSPLINGNFGYSLTQNGALTAAVVGQPGPTGSAGILYTFQRDPNDNYATNSSIILDATGILGFGNAVEFGEKNWLVAGASASNNNQGYAAVIYQVPGSNDYEITQLLVAPDQDFGATQFGHSVIISQDERWMYIGAPVANRVYCYGRQDVELQSVQYLGDGSTTDFNYNESLAVNSAAPDQIIVTVSNLVAVYGIDYTINGADVLFTDAPTAGQVIVISRRQAVQLDRNTYYNVVQDATSGSGLGAAFTITNTRGTYDTNITDGGADYNVGDTITIDYTQIDPTGTNANDLTITVDTVDIDGAILTFTASGSGVDNTDTFSLAPYLFAVTNIYSFTVIVDGVFQRPHIDYEFNTDSALDNGLLVFNTLPPPGAIIAVRNNTYWQYINSVTLPVLQEDAQFGYSIDTTDDGRQLLIGAPQQSAVDANNVTIEDAGVVYAYDRSVIAIQVTDAAQTTYTIPGTIYDPVSVQLNGTFLTNTDQYINGQFTISGSTLTIESTVTLTVGDIIEVATNNFTLMSAITAPEPIDQSQFGEEVTVCHSSCSLYIGAPLEYNGSIPQAGAVYRRVNQSRLYGVITTTIANPALTVGDTIRINDFEVAVPTDNTIAGLVEAINSANIPNAIATSTTDLVFTGDGITKVFSVGSIYADAASYTTRVLVGTTVQTEGVDYSYNSSTQQILFVIAPAVNAIITVVSGRITFSVKNFAASTPTNRITVLPGVIGTAFSALGVPVYEFTQRIVSPNPTDYAQFGRAIDIDTDSINLVIGAPNGDTYKATTFDAGETYFDDRSTTFFSPTFNSGVVYTYNQLLSANPSISNPGKFVFGQQITSEVPVTGDQFGWSVNYTNGRLLVGEPKNDLGDSTGDYGIVEVLYNLSNTPAWAVIHVQQPVVDIYNLDTVYSFDRLLNSTVTYYDFFDPLQGKILGAARRNLDYIGAIDPASYNTGPIHNNGNSWAQEHIGEMWWDTDTVRFIDPNQDDIVYASRRWGQVFPGSRIDVYQWVESVVAPSAYTGPGIPLSTATYTVSSFLDTSGIFVTRYYFWVRGINTINQAAGKTLSPVGVASYIESPKTSGIPYIAPLNSSTVAIYNAIDLITAQDTILHIGFDRQATDAAVHTEYELIADGKADSFLNPTLYRKFQDSLCGVTESGANVPDTSLSVAERYGVQFRPRQSMFTDRFTALENYLGRANTIIAQYPIVETRKFNLLNSSEPEPSTSSGLWNKRVANLEELSYQNLALVPIGYKYLVVSDSSQSGRWTIYEVIAGEVLVGSKQLQLYRIQNYDTKLYWTHIDWYLPGFNSSTSPLAQVAVVSALDTLSLTQVPVGGTAKVNDNGQGKFEIYQRTVTGWDRVGLQDGTIEFKEELWNYAAGNFGYDVEVFDAQYFDQEPVIETRKIIQAINEEIFIDDLAIERNQSLILMFNYIYSEFTSPDWLIKTSLVDVNHNIRALLPYQIYLQDNQTFVLDYIQEVKPYHVQIREFNLAYDGIDSYPGALTDFDVPAYYDTNLVIPQYVSPVLTPYTLANSSVENITSDAAPNAEIWTLEPWKDWFNNYLLSVDSVTVIDGGAGYTTPPQVTVTGDALVQAEMVAVINSAGVVIGIDIVNPGQGYLTTAEITITGGNGAGARAVVSMGNGLVRSIKTTIKYDRYQYSTTIFEWEPNVLYAQNEQVRYIDRVWSANESVSSVTFDPEQWTEVDSASLSGVDRTMGFYVAEVNMPGRELPLLIDGIDYPGVQVYGLEFNQTGGYDVANYDTAPFDNLTETNDGNPAYDPAVLDAIYSSQYLDPYLGTRPTDINVDGGEYVGPYESHAPEELIPGIEFDTLDLRVYTRPGADWLGVGHGFPMQMKKYSYVSGTPLSFAGLLPYPAEVIVSNVTQSKDLSENYDYTVDWVNQTVSVTTGSDGDTIAISVYELGGGNQLFKEIYNGADIGNTVSIPVQYDQIFELAIFVNGVVTTAFTFTELPNNVTEIVFDTTYGATDAILVVAIAPTQIDPLVPAINYSWSAPQTQVIVGDGSSLVFDLDNSMEYTNPDNLIVTVNGIRTRTSAGAEYIGDGTTLTFDLPVRLGVSQEDIQEPEVRVYINNVLQQQVSRYIVDAYIPSVTRTITFVGDAPAIGDQILVAVITNTQCYINGNNQLVFNPTSSILPLLGDLINVTTWNDTRQQNILTTVFVGPIQTGVTVTEGYDETEFDAGDITGDPGSYDYAAGVIVTVNDLTLTRATTDPSRLWVTLNGNRLFSGDDYTLVNNEIILTSGILSPSDTVIVTQFTESVVPEAMAFRIFQDMRGVQATYRITPATTTTLTQELLATDDIIYVDNASALGQPDFTANIWGVLTVDGERIMYRERNTSNNTVSSLLRGTAGTAAADHAVGASVYDLGRGNLLPIQYQNYIAQNIFIADGLTTTFTATNISILPGEDSTFLDTAVEVYVGGARVTSGYNLVSDAPVDVEFEEPIPSGVEVTILIRRGVTWYAPGVDTPSDGVPLQETNTPAARFLRGL